MKTRQQFEATYMFKENVMTYERYVEMETSNQAMVNSFLAKSQDELSADYQSDREANKLNKWSNE